MPLPKIEYPIHEIFLRSVGRKVKFRPFLVKEEKLLLVAKEADDPETAINTIKQIVNNCCIEDDEYVEDMPMFDIEMFFTMIRAKSVGETVDMNFKCDRLDEESNTVCGFVTPYTLDLSKICYDVPENHNGNIKINDKIGVIMKYPKLSITMMGKVSDVVSLSKSEGMETEQLVDKLYEATEKLLIENISCIYDEDSVYPKEEISEEELINFIEALPLEKVEEMRSFFNTQPKVVLKDTIACKKCGYMHDILAEDVYTFFI